MLVSKCDPWTTCIRTARKLIKNANSWPPRRITQSEFPVVESMHLHPPRASQMFLCKKKIFLRSTILHLTGAHPRCQLRAIWRALLCLGPTLGDSDLIGLRWGLRIEMLSEIHLPPTRPQGCRAEWFIIIHNWLPEGRESLLSLWHESLLLLQPTENCRYSNWPLEISCYFSLRFVSLTTQAAGGQKFSAKTCQNIALANTEVAFKICWGCIYQAYFKVYQGIFGF